MVIRILFLSSCFFAASAPFCLKDAGQNAGSSEFISPPGALLDGFVETPLSAIEQSALTGFPGGMKRFARGNEQMIVRYVTAATRKVHPAEMCFRAWGYSIEWRPGHADPDGRSACFEARREKQSYRVCEKVLGSDGVTFPDVGSWYYHAATGESRGPWWAILNATLVAGT